MGNTTERVYRISIKTDAAQQEVDATKKKLAELEAQFEGLDQSSDAAKGLIAEMAKLVKSLDSAEQEAEELKSSLDEIKPGTLPALEAEIEELEKAMRLATVGTAEFDEALLKLGNARGELKKLEDQLDIISDTKQHAAAFVDFANGVAGSFAIAQTAATSFGLGSDSLKEYEARMQSFLVVLSSLEAISKATNSETLGVIKSTYASAKAYLFASESASTSAKVTKAALISTGIGILVIGIALLVQNWDRLTSSVKGSAKFFTKVKAVASGLFDSAIASVKNFAGVIGKLFDGDFSGAVAKAKNIGKEVGAAYSKGYEESIIESHRKEYEAQIAAAARQIEVLKAKGRDTFKEEEKNLLAKLRLQKQGTEDEKNQYLELQKDLAVLRAANAKKEQDEALASAVARIGAVVAVEQAKGQESYRAQLSQKQTELAGLLAAETQNEAAIRTKRGEIAAFKAQHEQEQIAKNRARLVEAQQNEVALIEKQGKDTLALRIANARALLALDTGTTEQALAQKRADKQALLLLEEEANQREKAQREEFRQQAIEYDSNNREVDKAFVEGTADYLHEAYNKSLAKLSLGDTILAKLFGIAPEDLEQVKAGIAEAYNAIQQTVTQISTAILTDNISALDAQISAVQEQISQLDQEAQTHNQAAQDAESKLSSATGARRDYYLKRLNEERAAEAKALDEKRKAAAEEQRLAKEKEKSEKQLQAVSLATTAAQAIQAGISAVASAATIPFPANIPAILTAIATVGSAVLAAKQLGKSLGDGGIIEGGSHASGNDVPVFGGRYRVEGGEAITPVDATKKNAAALELIRTKGRARQLTAADFAEIANVRVLPHPTGRTFGAGGVLGANAGSAADSLPPGSVVVQQADLSEMLGYMRAVAAATRTTADYGPARLAIGHEQIRQMREEEAAAEQALAAGTL